ncbi:DUF2058 domain-containing protein [Bermanella sp. R86510]|uniref:DUF2058 domain-containing protein n=1 Tax=unclassified Bermanella TaxID=2627862 RepID=UPI0037C6F8F8
MANSLQEQLLKAGLTNKKKAKQVEREKQKVAKQKRQGEDIVDEAKQQAEAARLAKIERDKALNDAQNEKARTKAISAQIKQLIETNALNLDDANVDYNFTDGKKIKRLAVTDRIQYQLSRGMLAIAKLGNDYFVIPAVIADKIRQRNEQYIVSQVDTAEIEQIDEEDPYADYQIPDDLMW